MKLNTIVFGALIALSTSALQASEVKSNGDVKQPEILASVSTDKVVPLTAQEAKDTRGAYSYCFNTCGWGETSTWHGYGWSNPFISLDGNVIPQYLRLENWYKNQDGVTMYVSK